MGTAVKEGMNEGTQFTEWHSHSSFTKNNKNTILVIGKIRKFKTDCFVNAAANTVATNGRFKDLLRNYNSKALMMTSVWCVDKRK